MGFRKFSAFLSVIALCATIVFAQQQQTENKDKEAAAKAKSTKANSGKKPEKVVRTEKEWRKLLSRDQFKVLRQKGTERPFRNKYDKHFEPGKYACAACGQELFAADTKFNSGCGWPAFYAAMAGDRVILQRDFSLGMIRTEVICARCDSHLGHVFRDAPQTPTGARFCINSVSLKFIPADSKKLDTPKKQSRTPNKKSALDSKRDKSQ